MRNSLLQLLKKRGDDLCSQATRLILDFSSMHPINKPNQIPIISARGNHSWNPLSAEGKQLQATILPKINQFYDLIIVLSHDLPGTAHGELKSALSTIQDSITQDSFTWWETTEEACNGIKNLFEEVFSIMDGYYGNSTNEIVIIPDTNALLENPMLEQWQFESINTFTFVLVPSVISELDSQKVNHRNEDVRNKASALIRKFKEYRRRGDIHVGVSVIKDRIIFRAVATEPKMDKSLSWFDPANADDRFLAASLEIMRSNMGAEVYIVTSDFNMLNKADLAGIPSVEVPLSINANG